MSSKTLVLLLNMFHFDSLRTACTHLNMLRNALLQDGCQENRWRKLFLIKSPFFLFSLVEDSEVDDREMGKQEGTHFCAVAHA